MLLSPATFKPDTLAIKSHLLSPNNPTNDTNLKSSCSVHGPFRTSSWTIFPPKPSKQVLEIEKNTSFLFSTLHLWESMWGSGSIYIRVTTVLICFVIKLYNTIISDFAYQPYKWFRMLSCSFNQLLWDNSGGQWHPLLHLHCIIH